MNIKTKPLSEAFKKVSGLSSKRINLPILSCVRLSANGGTLEIFGTNLDCFAIAKCECDGDLEPICVNSLSFGVLLSAARETITLEIVNGNRLKVAGVGVAFLSGMDADEFAAFPKEKLTAIGVNAADLAECIMGVAWAANEKEQNMECCVSIKTGPKSIICAATNRKRLAYVDKPCIAAESEFMFPAHHASIFCDALTGAGANVSVSEKYAVCESDKLKIAVRLMEGNYFNVKTHILDAKRTKVGIIEKAPLIDALATAQALSGVDQWCYVGLGFGKDGVALSFKSAQNEYGVLTAGETEGKSVNVDARIFHTVLKHSPDVTLKASLATGMLMFESGDYLTAVSLLTEKKAA